MNPIHTYYLIDFENVGVAGLKGIGQLSQNDRIMIFFSSHCCKLDMRELAACGTVCVQFIEISPGNQSLDMHISSYIGYLACKHEENGCNIVVVSKDRGYAAVVNHWNRGSVCIRSFHSIEAAAAGKEDSDSKELFELPAELSMELPVNPTGERVNLEPESEKKAEAAIPEPSANQSNASKSVTENLTRLKIANNNLLTKTLVAGGISQANVGKITSLCAKTYGEANRKQLTYRRLISSLGKNQGLSVYNMIKNCL